MKLSFEIPLKTPSLNTLFGRGHWSKRNKLKDEWIEVVWAVCREQKIKPITEFPVVVTTKAYKSGKQLDADNACLSNKLIIDGLKKAGIIPDDTAKYVGFSGQYATEKGDDRVVVTIESMV